MAEVFYNWKRNQSPPNPEGRGGYAYQKPVETLICKDTPMRRAFLEHLARTEGQNGETTSNYAEGFEETTAATRASP